MEHGKDYLKRAEAAEAAASRSEDAEIKEQFLQIAKYWRDLADFVTWRELRCPTKRKP